jgi:GntR family transcriptional regulator, transcriptional repressor for pyruvate dehydrogenase complex
VVKVLAIRRTTASDEVFKTLHDWIASGKIRPGERLPSQEELAGQFSVSRNTLREAIHKLTALGLLSVRQGAGTIVQASHPGSYVTSLQDHLLLNEVTGREFLEARLAVETAVVRLAVRRSDPDTRERIRSLVDKQAKAIARGAKEEFSRLDTEFHLELARASGNRVFLKLQETILDLLRQFIRKVSDLPRAVEDALKFHRAIVQAMMEGDADGAEEVMLEHLVDVAKRINAHLGPDLRIDQAIPSRHARRKQTGRIGRRKRRKES